MAPLPKGSLAMGLLAMGLLAMGLVAVSQVRRTPTSSWRRRHRPYHRDRSGQRLRPIW